jgi:hypothetical protein
MRLYTQYMRDPVKQGSWIRSNVKKSTTDNLNLFLYATKAGLVSWLGAGNAMPTNNVSFGRFSGNAQQPVLDAGTATNTGLALGGYGTQGLLSNQNEIKTLFVTDEWFYDQMSTNINHHMLGETHAQQIKAAFEAQGSLRRAAVLAQLQASARGTHASVEAKIASMKLLLISLHETFVTVSGLASSVMQKLQSKKQRQKPQQISLNLDAVAPLLTAEQLAMAGTHTVQKALERKLDRLKAQLRTREISFLAEVARVEALPLILADLAEYNAQHP